VALALFLSYRILDIADLTTDGCFVLGMAVSVSMAAMGHPVLGLVLAVLSGACAGFVTAFLQTRLGVPSILAGIITNTGLYTVNLMAMGWSSNVSLIKQETIFTMFKSTGIGGSWYAILLGAAFSFACMAFMRWFLSTRLGLSIRATGDNRDMVSASSINPKFTITVGLTLANCFTALSGAIAGQLQKSADINAGTGIVVIGLATLIIGETVINGRKSLTRNILACLIGNIIYRLIYAIVLQTRVIPIEGLKLMTALIVALAIAMPTIRESIRLNSRVRREMK
jgi:putative ABC transport system permease protein